MDAMILAAGLGTRLRPLTDSTPKALIEIGGAPILERVARRLIAAGADRLIINTHHLGERIREYVESRSGFGVEVVFSVEEGRPLETGGGLLHARALFRENAPFFLHNADVLSDLPLSRMYQAHLEGAPLATLAVMQRTSSRQLLFDEHGLLGRADAARNIRLEAREPRGAVLSLAFAGVHVISPDIFDAMTERGAFSILDPYLRLSGEGLEIRPFRVDGARWIDIGKPDQLDEARRLTARETAGE